MIGAALLAMLQVAGQGAPCIAAKEVEGYSRPWYINGEAIVFEKKRYVKYGLPRSNIAPYVEVLGNKDGVPITAEKGVKAREVIYLLAEKAGCTFQPYQLEAN